MTHDQPSPGEYATQHLLRVIRRPSSNSSSMPFVNPLTSSTSTATKAGNAGNRYQYPLGPEIHPAMRSGRSHPLRGGMASLAAGVPGDRRGRIVKLDTPGAEAWRRQPAFQDSDEEGEDEYQGESADYPETEDDPNSPIEQRRRRRHPEYPDELVANAGYEEEGDDDMDADDDSDLGQPLGSRTPTLTTPSGRGRPQMQMSGGTVIGGVEFPTPPSHSHAQRQQWSRPSRRGQEDEDEDEEDYGQPVERTINTSPLPLSNRI